MFKKKIGLVVAIIMCLGLFAGCGRSLRITDFEGLNDLPKNPTKIIFGTNSKNVNEDGIYGEPIEYEVPSLKIDEVMDKLFAVKYKALPKNIDIDISPIERYLIIYNEDKSWIVKLGLQRHNGRWYDPINDKELVTLLYTFTSNEAI